MLFHCIKEKQTAAGHFCKNFFNKYHEFNSDINVGWKIIDSFNSDKMEEHTNRIDKKKQKLREVRFLN